MSRPFVYTYREVRPLSEPETKKEGKKEGEREGRQDGRKTRSEGGKERGRVGGKKEKDKILAWIVFTSPIKNPGKLPHH